MIATGYFGRYLHNIVRVSLPLWLVLFILPTYLFGLQFTKFGFIINLLWYDLIFYGWVRVKQKLGDDE